MIALLALWGLSVAFGGYMSTTVLAQDRDVRASEPQSISELQRFLPVTLEGTVIAAIDNTVVLEDNTGRLIVDTAPAGICPSRSKQATLSQSPAGWSGDRMASSKWTRIPSAPIRARSLRSAKDPGVRPGLGGRTVRVSPIADKTRRRQDPSLARSILIPDQRY